MTILYTVCATTFFILLIGGAVASFGADRDGDSVEISIILSVIILALGSLFAIIVIEVYEYFI